MQLIRRLCLLCFFFAIHSVAYSQDTLSLFYMTARYQLTETHKAQIELFLRTLDKSELDSIQIIGVADSTGNQRANDRLSLRRASHVERFLKDDGLILPMRLLAKGEDHDLTNALEKQRRVDIIFFAESGNEEPLTNAITFEKEADSTCYIFADRVIVEAFESIVQKGKKTYVQLEIDASVYTDSVKYYLVHEDPKTKKPILKVIKWKQVVSGEEWWRKTRYVAFIPKEDYSKTRIVRESKENCDSIPNDCGFRLSDTEVSIKTAPVLMPAVFLLQNTRVQRKVFKRHFFRIEVPKQYVSSGVYFFDESGKYPVEWFTKKGKKKRNRYYANVHEDLLDDGKLMIYTYFPVTTCFEKNRHFRHVVGILCGTRNFRNRHLEKTSLGLEIGDRNIKPTHFGYLGLYSNYSWNGNELNLSFGLDTKAAPYTAFRYDKHLVSLNPVGLWRKTQVYGSMNYSIYSGTMLDFSLRKNNESMLNHDLHLGIDYTGQRHAFSVQRLFLEAGVQVNYLGKPLGITPKFVLGLQFRF